MKEVQLERLREARATGAEVLVTACPKCQIHFACAMNDPNLAAEITMGVRDLATQVAARLAAPDRDPATARRAG
jgi:heterodisulfide reductase subunit D